MERIYRKIWLRLLLIGFVSSALLVAPRRAEAIHPDARAVVMGGLYGLAAGTVAGIASLPFSGDNRTVFIGSSVGMYLGMVVGIYYAIHRNDPANPLRKTLQDYQESKSGFPAPNFTIPPALVEFAYPVLRF